MDIRKASAADIPAIVELLKASLGEDLLPKSEAFWRWKHIGNPYGESPVFVASVNDRIVGVRGFMQWGWVYGNRRISTVRAVDTATHPDFQGKGIFTKLTRSLLADCNADGFSFVFNTPNKRSLPGYLKMGWVRAGQIPLAIKVIRPLKIGLATLNFRDAFDDLSNDCLSYYLTHTGLPGLLHKYFQINQTRIITELTAETLCWRYQKVPIVKYYAAGSETKGELQGVFFYRLKFSRLGRELRITDFFLRNSADLRKLKAVLKEKVQLHKADFVSFSGLADQRLLAGFTAFHNVMKGPLVTIREIQNGFVLGNYKQFKEWSPSLGDLELF